MNIGIGVIMIIYSGFSRLLKTHFFVLDALSALEALCDNVLYKLTLTV